MIKRWCKNASQPRTKGPRDQNRRRRKGEAPQGRSLPPSSIFNPYCWLKKTMFKQGETPRKVTCSTHIRTEEEDVVEQEADSTKDDV